ncbi:MAG: hypothetical protein V5A77_00020 [Candidatus Bipolaricaulota bacterium]|nr:hypothetical protein [Candidatus Bipolaricaulota bacterium]
MFTGLNSKKIALLVAPLVLLFVFSLGASGVQDEECCLYQEKPECPDRYSSFNPSQDTYSPGETVKLTLSGLTEEHLIEEIKIEKLLGKDEGVVYTEVIDQQVPVDQTEWTWSWNQIGSHGEQVANGRYFALVETYCCGIYRTNFKVLPQVRPVCSCNCCGRWSTKLDTGCSRYETGEEVMVNFSNCRDCDINFRRLYIERSDRCCGGNEIVFSHHFEGGFDPGRNWSWGWNQLDADGNVVEPGRYTVVVETECCGTLKAGFTVYESRDCCQSSCCGSGFLFFGSCRTSCSSGACS